MSQMGGDIPSVQAARVTIKFVPDTSEVDAFARQMDQTIEGYKAKWQAAMDLRPMLRECEQQLDRIIQKAASLNPQPRPAPLDASSGIRAAPVPDQTLGLLTELLNKVGNIDNTTQQIDASVAALAQQGV